MGNDCPCKGCVAPKRHVGCHGTCKGYTDWKTADVEKKAAERKRKEDEAAMYESYKHKRR